MEDNANVDSKSVRFARQIGVLTFLTGITVTAVSSSVLKNYNSLLAFQDVSTAVGIRTVENFATYTYLLIAGAVMCILVSILGIIGGQLNNRVLVFIYVIGTLLVSVVELTGASLLFDFINEHSAILCVDADCNPVDTPFKQWQIDMLDLELTIFNECCYDNLANWTIEQTVLAAANPPYPDVELATKVQLAPTPICDELLDGTFNTSICPALPQIVEDTVPGIGPRLCTCIKGTEEQVNSYYTAITPATCNELSKVKIAVSSATSIPTEPPVGIFSILNPQYQWFRDNVNSITAFPLVGTPGIIYDEINESFGCGLGFSKGFILYVDLYINQTFGGTVYAGIACGSFQILVAFLTLVFMGITQSESGDLEYVDDNEYSSSPVTPMGMAYNSGAPVTTVQTPPPVPGRSRLTRKQVAEKLKAFYLAYEPSKLVDGEVDEDVINFVMTRGIDALNEKLRAKYGADLDTFNPDGNRFARKVLDEDFEV